MGTGWPWGLALVATVAACSHDWDAYDPRLAGGGGACTPGEASPCYTGPEGTEGVGACVAGAKTCSEAGAFGACEGEVTPRAEDCGTPADDDCDGEANPVELCGCEPNVAVDCYEGPAGTEGTGVCVGGQKICNDDGMSFGPCLGQETPSVEACGDADDNDCNGASDEHCAAWAKRFGNGSNQHAFAVAVDGQGDAIFTGDMAGTANFGGSTLTSAGGVDLFVAKLDTRGNHLWSTRYGDSAGQTGRAIAVDPDGNVFVAGGFQGVLAAGGPTAPLVSAGLEDVFVIKLDPLGNPLWSVGFGDAGAQTARGIAAGPDGSVVVTGEFAGTVDFGGGPLASAEALDGFVLKLAADGTHVWSLRFGGGGDDTGHAVATGPAGAVYLTGSFESTISLGGPLLDDLGGTDMFVAELTATGAHAWTRTFGPGGDQRGVGVAVDPAGGVLVTGDFDTAIDFGSGAVASKGSTDAFVLKLDAAGEVVWNGIFGDAAEDEAHAIAVDAAGQVVAVGAYAGTVDFGGGPLTAAGPDDIYLLALDPAGGYRYSRSFGDAQDQDPFGAAFDGQGNLFLVGELAGAIEFGPGPIVSAGGNDAFIAKIPP